MSGYSDDRLQISEGTEVGAVNIWDRVMGAREPSGRRRQVKRKFASSACAQMHAGREATGGATAPSASAELRNQNN